MSWSEARVEAAASSYKGVAGRLVAILTEEEDRFIDEVLLRDGQSPWIGASDEETEDEWKWVTGEVFWIGGPEGQAQGGLFADWGEGQPAGDDAGAIQPDRTWGAAPLDAQGQNGFLVEFPTGGCPGDFDADEAVGMADLCTLLAAWGVYAPCPPFRPEDISSDCAVGFADLLEVLANWGPCDAG